MSRTISPSPSPSLGLMKINVIEGRAGERVRGGRHEAETAERETAKVLTAHKKALRAAVSQRTHSSPPAATEHTHRHN